MLLFNKIFYYLFYNFKVFCKVILPLKYICVKYILKYLLELFLFYGLFILYIHILPLLMKDLLLKLTHYTDHMSDILIKIMKHLLIIMDPMLL
jgi:hypothetical protein